MGWARGQVERLSLAPLCAPSVEARCQADLQVAGRLSAGAGRCVPLPVTLVSCVFRGQQGRAAVFHSRSHLSHVCLENSRGGPLRSTPGGPLLLRVFREPSLRGPYSWDIGTLGVPRGHASCSRRGGRGPGRGAQWGWFWGQHLDRGQPERPSSRG